MQLFKMVEKIYELTTNGKDGFAKWYVRGIKDDEEARKIAKMAFGKFYSKTLISYYDNYPSEYGTDWSKTPTIAQFLKITKKYRK